jgi:polysaccharide biosynthesis protein PelA
MPQKKLHTFLLLFFCFFFFANSLAQAQTPLKRKILAIYSSSKEINDPSLTSLHQNAEMPLNHLGLDVYYHDVNKPLPSSKKMRDYLGIISWFRGTITMKNTTTYCRWLKQQMLQGIKLVILEEPGFMANSWDSVSGSCQDVFELLGVKYLADYQDDPLFTEIKFKDSSMVEFERKISLNEGLDYRLIRPIAATVKPYLQLTRTNSKNSKSTLVFTSKRGGYAAPGFVIYENVDLIHRHWRINPFKFFAKAFGIENSPIPDTTTLNGNRIFYSHIDGDGIFNMSKIDRKSFSGEIIDEGILKQFSDMPVTVSIITGYLDIQKFQSVRSFQLYKNMFTRPNVEVASHGHGHPLNWRKGTLAITPPGYVFSAKKEIQGSISMIRELLMHLDIKKTVDLFLWTGDCLPNESQIELADNFGAFNVNGGDTRFDRQFPSYAFVYPLGLNFSKSRQIYSSNSNENTYTGLWEGPHYGFKILIETFQRTESPIRVKPANIYYHFYSGERHAGLISLSSAYEYAKKQDIFGIFTSEYARIANDFYVTKIFPLKGGGYEIRNKGYLKTIRFDNTDLNIDFNRSKNILGFRHFQNSLYVSLGEQGPYKIFLTSKIPTKPYVIQASFHVGNFKHESKKISFTKQGWANSRIRLGGLTPKQNYLIQTKHDKIQHSSDKEGVLSIQFSTSEGTSAPVATTITPVDK